MLASRENSGSERRPFLCLGLHGLFRRDEVTLTAYGVYLVLAVGFCSYMLVQLGLSMTCSSLPGDAREVGAYICGIIEASSQAEIDLATDCGHHLHLGATLRSISFQPFDERYWCSS